MMRADRLVAVLLILQRRGRVTAAAVADELEVSERTARRDLEALTMAGVPVYPIRGRGGGWELVGGATTDLTGLTATEARALLVAAATGAGSAVTTAGDPSGGEAVARARRKLAQALPAPFQSEAAAVEEAIHVDRNPWRRTIPPHDARHLDLLQQAVLEERRIRLAYQRPGGEPSDRVVDPYGLVTKASIWYLIGGTAKGRRTFRVSRVLDVELLDTPAPRPPDFDLAAAWTEIKTDFGASLTDDAFWVDIEIGAWALGPLQGLGAITVGDPTPTVAGDLRVRVTSSQLAPLVHAVAGFGHNVRVLGPPSIQAELVRIGEELVADYGEIVRSAYGDTGTAAASPTAERPR